MAVKVSKLWGNSKFLNLSNSSKLFYLYLATSPNISYVGVCNLNLEVIGIQLNMTQNEIRQCSSELLKNDYIKVYKHKEEIYFVVLAHFDSLPKSDTTILRVTKDLDSLPSVIKQELMSIGIKTDRKVVTFKAPTAKEITDYALSQGYKIEAQTVIDYYYNKGVQYGKKGLWYNGRGKQVKDWKATLRKVWFRDENKLKVVDGAPKGFEHFYVEFEGKTAYPESWKGGRPHHSNFAVSIALQKEYEKRTKNS